MAAQQNEGAVPAAAGNTQRRSGSMAALGERLVLASPDCPISLSAAASVGSRTGGAELLLEIAPAEAFRLFFLCAVLLVSSASECSAWNTLRGLHP